MLAQTDLFVAATERARAALLLEGVPEDKIVISQPGIRVDRFRASGRGSRTDPPMILCPGRLVWEKGHQDMLRAVAALRRGIAGAPDTPVPRVVIVGAGPHERTLRRYADELGVGDLTEFRAFVPYGQMPDLFAQASCMVLASLAQWFWEEQFGMVLAEALAAGTPIYAAGSGAIPEVLHGQGTLFTPGDWPGLARLLAEGPLAGRPGPDPSTGQDLVARYSTAAAADRLAEAYAGLLA